MQSYGERKRTVDANDLAVVGGADLARRVDLVRHGRLAVDGGDKDADVVVGKLGLQWAGR